MGSWHKTGCVLCAQNCGLEVLVEDNKMIKVRPDKDNPRSRGYACRKGLSIIYHQYPEDRLTQPLKRVGDKFEPISWDKACKEIAERLQKSVEEHGSRSFAYLGSSSQGGHLEASYGISILRSFKSQNLYTSAGQEFSGIWWVQGRMFGKQYLVTGPDHHNAQMLIAWGWNGMVSHQMPRAPRVLNEISKDPDRILVSIDPRESETAKAANIHLAIRPGTDALLVKSMISIIVDNGWENSAYIEKFTKDWDKIKSWFEGFDYKEAVKVCDLDYEEVLKLCRLMTEKKWAFHSDLGIYMGRHSVYNSYLLNILGAVCGIFGEKGGNIIPGMMVPMGFHADEREAKTWKTAVSGFPPGAAGSFPCSALPDEILTTHPDRIRNVIVSSCNPIRSWPDTSSLEKAFSSLDLLVVMDIAMSETARLADYVLPCKTFYESWDGTFFPWTFPEVYFQLRKPIVKSENDSLEASQIFTLLADKLGLIPEIPEDLMEAASKDRLTFAMKLMTWIGENPQYMKSMVFILGKTLGEKWDSAALAALWGVIMTAPKRFRENAKRIGFEKGPDMGDRIFQAILDNPQGLWVGKEEGNNLDQIKTESGKIELFIPELSDKVMNLNPASEKADLELPKQFPLLMNAGRHTPQNMNTMMRNPDWNKGKRAFAIAVSPGTADDLNLKDGDIVNVFTEAGEEKGELEISKDVRDKMVLIPHGFGLLYGDKDIYGININYLTKHTNRDILGTPVHRFVPCRLEKA